jgi:predicted RNase H-like HicB family nuclease
MDACVIRAFWDEEAGVWVAESDDVPGLVAEAPTPRELEARLKVLIPELLELNAPGRKRGVGEIVARFEHEARINLSAA